MMDKLSFAVIAPEAAARAEIARGLGATGAIRVVTDGSRPEEIEAALRGAGRVGLYVDLSGDPEKALGWIEALAEPKPSVLAGGPADPALILRAMRAGVLAYFPEHRFDGELTRVAQRLQEQAALAAPPKAGHAVAVVGAKGGVGCTTVACELAASLARDGRSVALFDARAYFGDVALHLDLTPAYTLADVAERADDLDGAFLATVAQLHEGSGVHVVAAPLNPEEADGIQAGHLQRALELLRGEFDFVVADLPRITDEAALQCLDKSDLVVLVTTSDVPSLVRAKQHLALLEQLGHGAEKVRVVANRSSRPGVLAGEDPLRAIGVEAAAYVPCDADALEASLASGRPLCAAAPKSKFAAAFAGLAGEIGSRFAPEVEADAKTLAVPVKKKGLAALLRRAR
jgi:pilus assembly protein CpaE